MRRQLVVLFVVLAAAATVLLQRSGSFIPSSQAVSTSVVISQVYGGAGCGTAGCSTYKNDYIELFNRGASAVSLNGWSVQYAAATGTAWQVTNLTNVTLQPGQYYLVAESSSANGVNNIPTPDATGTIAMSATAAKVALLNTTTALTGACPTGAQIVDLVGYGSTANCSETAVAPAPSTTTADVRAAAGCTDTDNNSTDFTATTPNPRNTATALAPCGGGAGTPTLSINDVSQNEGNALTTAFTFTVSLSGAAPAGGVSFNWSTADGTATAPSDYTAVTNGSGSITAGNTQTTVTVNVNGDTTTEPNETFFVNISNITNATAGDTQGQGTIVNDDITLTPINQIQGSGNSAPPSVLGTTVTTTGIVTGRKTNGYIIQDPNPDSDPNTSEAIFVFTSSTPSASINIGDSVRVTGTVAEFEPSTTDEPDGVTPSPDPKTATELTSPTTTILSSGNTLPAALDADSLNIFNPSALSRGAELEKYEYMRVSVGSITVAQPTNGFGEFWGVRTGVGRPFREPGVERGDPIPAADDGPYAGSAPPNVPVWDGNFERIMVDSDDATDIANNRRASINVTTGAVVTGVVGPLDYVFVNGTGNYRIMLDFAAAPGVTPGITAAVPVPTPTTQEFTVGHANLENFSSSNATKLAKASLAVRNVLRTPDVLGIIEVDTATSASDLANKINTDYGDTTKVNYVAYFNDIAANTQDIGYLVNTARVTVNGSIAPYHQGNTFTYCGVSDTLHDRPSLVLSVNAPQAGGGTIPVTLILNHTKSLIAVDSPQPFGTCGTGTTGARNREKRRLQAEDIADLIQSHINENLVVLGDFNALDFNDGFIDVMGTIKGNPAPPDQVVEPSTDRWSYSLTNLLTKLPATEQYSLLFEGNAQALDHVLVNSRMLARNTRYAYSRYDADFSANYSTDATRPERTADHDAPVAYFSSAAAVAAGQVAISEFRFRGPNGASDEFVELYNTTGSNIVVGTTDGSPGWALVAADGSTRFIVPNNTTIPAHGHFLAVNTVGYSLASYAAGNTVLLPDGVTQASGYTADIPDGSGIALFNTANAQNFSLANRLDAAGYAGVGSLYFETTGFPTGGAETQSNLEYSFVRNMRSGYPQDTDNNAADFLGVQTYTPSGAATGQGSYLGAPGPENLSSPVVRTTGEIIPAPINPAVSSTASPNRVRNTDTYHDALTPSGPAGTGTDYTLGTLSAQKRFTNNTGAPITRLRFRIIDITTLGTPNIIGGGTQADIRVLSSNGTVTATGGGTVITVRGVTLEQPPTQARGGGWNSTVSLDLSGLPGGALANGQSVDVQFLLGVASSGSFRFFIVTEAN